MNRQEAQDVQDATTGAPKPAWWLEVDPPTYPTEEAQAEAKIMAAGQVLGYAMNLTSAHQGYIVCSTWFKPEDFPGVMRLIAENVLWRDDYDGDLNGLVWRIVNGGQGQRIRNGALVTDLYWNASLAGWEQAAHTLWSIRHRERQVEVAQRALQRLHP